MPISERWTATLLGAPPRKIPPGRLSKRASPTASTRALGVFGTVREEAARVTAMKTAARSKPEGSVIPSNQSSSSVF